ncbi:hypothetical protein J2T55_001691 [Methylohalomonas lacus]|uniref:Glutaredoxin n=1 Tax=Methylohalomonas lacus TaxID=398773 RepID=A0AAE3HN71_9GAMM|nr:hypothetical protein [Methylohalomonas lacus]MCS3903662.1 hypothetical protein [Methylohalomonas lacus]
MTGVTKITMVKKILADGSPCRKCEEVETRLRDEGYLDRIDHVVVADERDPDSEGMQLANRYQIERAPFFIVEEEGREPRVYTVFLRFMKEVLQTEVNARSEAAEIMRNDSMDYI